MNQAFFKVTGYEEFRDRSCARGAYSYFLKLACGHQVKRKGSCPVPHKAHCPFCPAPAGEGEKRP
jgi:hypothetical protein